MKITVIIPVYNTKRSHLLKCIDSVLAQTLKDIEIIVIDNGSTKNNYSHLSDIVRGQVKITLLVEPNGRQGKARNAGLLQARGEYIAFLDSDDYLLPNCLDSLYRHAKESSVDVLKTDFYTLWNSSGYIEETRLLPSYALYNKQFNVYDEPDFLKAMPYIWNGLYRTDFLKDNEIYFDDYRVNEDHLFTWKANFLASKILVIPDAGIVYRRNHGSVSESLYKNSTDLLAIYCLIQKFLTDSNVYDKFKLIFLQSKIRDFIYISKHLDDCVIKKQYLLSIKATIESVDLKCADNFLPKEFIALYFFIKTTTYKNWKEYLSLVYSESSFLYDSEKRLSQYCQSFDRVVSENKDKKILLYGAGIFANKVFGKLNCINYTNIIGVLDKSTSLIGKKFYSYNIYHPSHVKELAPDIVMPMMQDPRPVIELIQNMKFLFNLNYEIVII